MKKLLLLLLLPIVGFSQTYFSEDFETATDLTSAGWTMYNDTNTPQGAYANLFTNAWAIVGWNDENGNKVASTTSWFTPVGTADRWLVTPAITIPAGESANLIFKVRSHDTNVAYQDGFELKLSTTDTEKTSFTVSLLDVEAAPNPGTMAATDFTTVDLSAYAGETIYLTWINTDNDHNLLSIDDVSVEGGCGAVSGLDFTDYTTTTATIEWTDAADVEIEFGEYPYTQGSGSTPISLTNVSSYDFTSLDPATSYDVYVRVNCGAGEFSSWQDITIGTLPEEVSVFPYETSFEPAANQALLLNIGISRAGDTGAWSFGQDDTTDNDTTNDYALDGTSYFFSGFFTDADYDAYLYLTPMSLTANTEYSFSFNHRILSDATTTVSMSFDAIVSTANDGTGSTVLGTYANQSNLSYANNIVTFTPTADGTYYFGLHNNTPMGASATTGNAIIADDFMVYGTLNANDFTSQTISTYPNPANNVLNINAGNLEVVSVKVIDLNGRTVISQKNTSSINVSSLVTGAYMVSIETANGTTVQKFIKN